MNKYIEFNYSRNDSGEMIQYLLDHYEKELKVNDYPSILEDLTENEIDDEENYYANDEKFAYVVYLLLRISNDDEAGEADILKYVIEHRENIFSLLEITNIMIPDNVKYIRGGAFKDCTVLTNVMIPDSIKAIGEYVFAGCSALTSICIPKGVTYIGKTAFHSCSSLTSVTIPEGVTTIEGSAFSRCTALTSVYIPTSVTSIRDYAFYCCNSLTSVTIPEGVTVIDVGAFAECENLSSISVDSSNPVYDSRDNCNAIIETASNTLISGCKNTVIPSDIIRIENTAFNGCTGLLSIRIPSSVKEIGEYAFENCSVLTSITIPEGVTLIGGGAFAGCGNLSSINVDSSNTVYDSRDNCNAIIETASNTLVCGCKNTIIPAGIKRIGYASFAGCSGLASIEIPEGVEYIEDDAFINCQNLTTITLPSTLISIGYDAWGYLEIIYHGTISQWDKIYHEYFYAVVHCTDGDITVEP